MPLNSSSSRNSSPVPGDAEVSTTSGKRKVSSEIPRLVDNKRRHMERTLSQAQRDQLLLNSAKDYVVMKRDMMAAIDKSNQSLDQSIDKMTNCLTAIGEGIASGIKLMAQALIQQPNQYVPAPYPPQYMYGPPGMAAPSISMHNTPSTMSPSGQHNGLQNQYCATNSGNSLSSAGHTYYGNDNLDSNF